MNYHIKLGDGTVVPVTEEVYRAYKRPQWSEIKRNQGRRVKKRVVKLPLSYDRLVESGYPIEKHLPTAPSPEEMVESEQTLELLYSALETLAQEEKVLVEGLFYERQTEREYARRIGVPRSTVAYQKSKVLAKLRNLLGHGRM